MKFFPLKLSLCTIVLAIFLSFSSLLQAYDKSSIEGVYHIKNSRFKMIVDECYKNVDCLRGPKSKILVLLGFVLSLNEENFTLAVDENLVRSELGFLDDYEPKRTVIASGEWGLDGKTLVLLYKGREKATSAEILFKNEILMQVNIISNKEGKKDELVNLEKMER